jgi:hypothetical protein
MSTLRNIINMLNQDRGGKNNGDFIVEVVSLWCQTREARSIINDRPDYANNTTPSMAAEEHVPKTPSPYYANLRNLDNAQLLRLAEEHDDNPLVRELASRYAAVRG